MKRLQQYQLILSYSKKFTFFNRVPCLITGRYLTNKIKTHVNEYYYN